MSETCIDCPQASYQDEAGTLSCKPCPVGYTTYQVKSLSENDCKGNFYLHTVAYYMNILIAAHIFQKSKHF